MPRLTPFQMMQNLFGDQLSEFREIVIERLDCGINQAQIGDLVGPTNVLTTVSTVDPVKVEFPISEREYLKFAVQINRESIEGTHDPNSPKLEWRSVSF